MADGSVTIDIKADDSDIKKKLDGVESDAKETADGLDKLSDSADNGTDGLDKLGDKADDTGDKFGVLDGAISSFIGNAMANLASSIVENISNIANLAEETREYREDMAKLETAFITTGHSQETAKEAYESFYAILGESDRSVEAANHLAELTDNAQEVAKWGDIAAGVTAKFGDSLPLEGLTEAANETAKVGKTTGVLADALNWASGDSEVFAEALGENDAALKAFNSAISKGLPVEDAFSEALSKMSSEQERSSAITRTLNGLYKDAAGTYNELTAETQAARKAQSELEQTQAALGKALEPVTTKFTELKTKAMQWFIDTGLPMLQEGFSWLSNNLPIVATVIVGCTTAWLSFGAGAKAITAVKVAFDALKLSMTTNPFGWVVLGLTAVAAGIMALTSETEKATEAVSVLTEKEKKLVEGATEANAAFQKQRETFYESASGILSTKQHYESLVNELDSLVAANGRVEEADRGRVNFILSELNNAYGTEYTMVNGVVQKYDELKTKIFELMDAKTAEALLEAKNENYIKALEEEKDAYAAMMAAEKDYMAQKAHDDALLAEMEALVMDEINQKKEAELAGDKKRAKEAEKLHDDRISYLYDELEAQWVFESKKRKAYDEATQHYAGVTATIGEYTDAQTAALQGNYKASIDILTGKSVIVGEYADSVDEATQRSIDALMEEAIKAGVAAERTKHNFESGVEGYTQEMVDEAKKAHDDALLEWANAYNDANGLGVDLSNGLRDGMNSQLDSLITSARNIIANIWRNMKDEADSHSPSRKTMALGKDLDAGLAIGIEKNADRPIKAAQKMVRGITEYLEDEQKKSIKTVKSYNDEIEKINKKHNDDLWEENYDHSRTMADLEKAHNERIAQIKENSKGAQAKINKEIAKENESYNKNVEREKDRHIKAVANLDETMLKNIETQQDNIRKLISDKMQEIVNLGNTYKDEVKTLWEDLDNSITSLQQEYDNQLASRTESIASSLGLWSEIKIESPHATVLTNNLKTQVRALERYNAAIANLEERGLDEAFINQLKGLGVGSVGEIETLSRMSDERLQDYVDLWQKKNELAHDAALEELEPLKAETEAKIQELTDAATVKYEEMRAKFEEQGGLLAAELKQAITESGLGGYEAIIEQIDDYKEAGVSLMDGITEGIVQESPVLARVVATAVEQAIEAAKETAGIASPSKVMKKEVGANLAAGVSVGWAEKIDAIKNKMSVDMQGITTKIKTAIAIENARMSQSVGVRDTGFTDIAQAVGMQTAGINSLASEYRRGSTTQVTVPLVLDGRELGRAIVELGNEENTRVGTNLATT